MLALLALAVLSPSPHNVGAPTATPDAVRPRVALFTSIVIVIVIVIVTQGQPWFEFE